MDWRYHRQNNPVNCHQKSEEKQLDLQRLTVTSGIVVGTEGFGSSLDGGGYRSRSFNLSQSIP